MITKSFKNILTALQAERNNTKAPKTVKDEPSKIIGLEYKATIIEEWCSTMHHGNV
jgi:hypothetical protein